MKLLFDLAGRLVKCAMCLMALWSDKVRKIVQGRKDTLVRLEGLPEGADRIWFHVASLGEFEQARPLIEAYRVRHPEVQLVLSFFSSSGYEVRKDYTGVDAVVYLPADTLTDVSRFLDVLLPRVAVFVKYDFWPTMLSELSRRKIKTYLAAAIFREDQLFFRPWGGWYRGLLSSFERIYVQDEASAELLCGVGIDRVVVAGDTRCDRVYQIATSPRRVVSAEWLRTRYTSLLVSGSTWPADDELIVQTWSRLESYGLILVPHELDDSYIDRLIAQASRPLLRLSTLAQLIQDELEQQDYEGIVVDCIGLLSSLYQYATVAYIGGGFDRGIHNSLEAAVYGIPVLFGPKIDKFREAKALVACGAARVVRSAVELHRALEDYTDGASLAQESGAAALSYIKRELGATEIILQGIDLQNI